MKELRLSEVRQLTVSGATKPGIWFCVSSKSLACNQAMLTVSQYLVPPQTWSDWRSWLVQDHCFCGILSGSALLLLLLPVFQCPDVDDKLYGHPTSDLRWYLSILNLIKIVPPLFPMGYVRGDTFLDILLHTLICRFLKINLSLLWKYDRCPLPPPLIDPVHPAPAPFTALLSAHGLLVVDF